MERHDRLQETRRSVLGDRGGGRGAALPGELRAGVLGLRANAGFAAAGLLPVDGSRQAIRSDRKRTDLLRESWDTRRCRLVFLRPGSSVHVLLLGSLNTACQLARPSNFAVVARFIRRISSANSKLM